MLHRLAELDAAGAPGLCRFRLQAHLRRAQRLHDRRTSRRSISTSARTRSTAIRSRRRRARPASPCSTICSARTVTWLAPMLPFTAEEAWLARYPSEDGSVHLELFPELPAAWRDDALAEKWRKVRNVAPRGHRRARDRARAKAHRLLARGRTRSSTCPTPTCSRRWSISTSPRSAITSAATLVEGEGPPTAFRLDDVKGGGGRGAARGRDANAPARGRSCRASAPIRPIPTSSPRDAQALREWDAMRKAAE